MSEERLLKIESKLEGHDKDFHNIAKSLDGINEHMGRTNELIQESIIKDERMSSHIKQVESGLASRIDTVHQTAARAHERVDAHDAMVSRIVWAVLLFVGLGMAGAVVKFGG